MPQKYKPMKVNNNLTIMLGSMLFISYSNAWSLCFVFPSAAKPTATVQPAKEQFLISPITGERIPASKMADHMRYGTYVILYYY